MCGHHQTQRPPEYKTRFGPQDGLLVLTRVKQDATNEVIAHGRFECWVRTG
jgi:hypothetical protein